MVRSIVQKKVRLKHGTNLGKKYGRVRSRTVRVRLSSVRVQLGSVWVQLGTVRRQVRWKYSKRLREKNTFR